MVLIVELFRDRLWAYPFTIITLAVFVCYQVYRFALTHSLVMILLTLFDLLVVVLTSLEYRKQKSLYQSESAKSA